MNPRTLLTLLVPLTLTACPGTGDPSLRRKADAGQPDTYVSRPRPSSDGGAQPQDPEPLAADAGAAPTQVNCTPVDSVCGSGQAGCCSGSLCVSFSSGAQCATTCSAASQCAESCCVGTAGGSSVCAPASYCGSTTEPTDPTTPTSDTGSCNGNCGGQAASGCYCDGECQTYGDCCADISTYCGY